MMNILFPHAAVRFKMDNAYFKNPFKEFKNLFIIKIMI